MSESKTQQTPSIIIDVREENELLENKLVSLVEGVEIINIPSRNIFANVDWIRSKSLEKKIWLICRSSARSDAIKAKYFTQDNGVLSSQGGIQYIIQEKELSNKTVQTVGSYIEPSTVEIVKGKGGFGMQQYLQLAFATMLLVIAMLNTILPKTTLNNVIYVMIMVILYQIYTKSCWLGKVIPRATFEPVEIKHQDQPTL